MQLYALEGKTLIPATGARQGKNYYCPECAGPVRLKSGDHKRPHFFHLSKAIGCIRSQRGAEHIELQLYIQKLLPESILECRFPEIGRIADVAWPKGKTIFEIQFSPISEEEALKRCQDYERLGFRLVWVLHNKHFNKKILSRSEAFLRKKTCYYSNMNKAGVGIIYDQWEQVFHRFRSDKGRPLPIDLSHPSLMSLSLKSAPPTVRQREGHWPLYHQGDLVDLFLQGELNEISIKKNSTKKPALSLGKRYRSLLYILLELFNK